MPTKARAAALAAVLALATSIAACGSDSGSGSSGSGKKLRVTFVAALVNDSYFVTVKCGAQAQAKEMGVDLKWTGPATNDVQKEISAFQSASLTNPDGMVLAPFSNTGFGGVVRPLMKKGIPVALSGQTLEPADGLVTYITDFEQGGNSLADEIKTLTGGTGTMGLIADTTGNKTDSDRYTGLVPILKEQQPQLKVLKPQYGENSAAKSASIASSLIRANPDMKLIYATSGPEAVGAASAIAAAKAGDKVKLISFDSNQQQIALLKQNKLAATVAQSPYQSGALTVKAVVDYVKSGKKGAVPASDKIENTPTKLLTPENVNDADSQKYQYLEKCSDGATQGATS